MNNKIKITQRDETQRSFIIELGGMDISKYVTGVNISLIATKRPRVTLELVPFEIEIPAELEAIITTIRDSAMDDK